MTHGRNSPGFTVIELVVAIAVMGAMIVSIPAFRSWQSIMQVNNAARIVAQDLRFARSMAVDRASNVIVSFDLTGHSYSVYIDADADGPQIYDLEKTVTLGELAAGIQFNSSSEAGVGGGTISAGVMLTGAGNPPSCTFRPNGEALNPGSVYLLSKTDAASSSRDRNRAVQILSTGRITPMRWSGQNPSDPWVPYF
ncbi:MAG: GspH/FimT family pseudopilin [Deltaproteobacteria bacterium]|nr:GspH/FimT family pseudopilin [Deltaproteobacteria bacterium]